MSIERGQQNSFEALSHAELISQAKHLVEKIENLGYPGLNLALLITGSRYRLDSIRYDAIRKKEEELSRELTDEEKDTLWKKMGQEYEPLSPDNLTEVYRYQYNREQQEDNLNGPKYPELNTQEYQQIREIFVKISSLLSEFMRRNPDKRPSEYLPMRLSGKWID